MRSYDRRPAGPWWNWAALAGLLVFLFVQVLPAALAYDAGDRALSRKQAENAALRLAADRFGLQAESVSGVEVTHLSDSDAVGYLSKEKQMKTYEKEWYDEFPTDSYRAELAVAGSDRKLTIYVHMETGRLLGWEDAAAVTADGADADGSNANGSAQRALAYASLRDIDAKDWEWTEENPGVSGEWTFQSRKSPLGEARLLLHVRVPSGYDAFDSSFPAWEGGRVAYDIAVPEDFAAYLEEQKKLAGNLNAAGFILPQLLMLALAIVYAIVLRKKTSFRRGAFLSVIFFLLYAVFYFNMIPGFRAGLLAEGETSSPAILIAMLIANLVVLAGMTLLTYFSAVAGDGLWRSMGANLWPRWQDDGFGRELWQSVRRAYPLAFLLLGVQSVILVGLQNGIGMFQSSDASQSTYNMTVPWLLLLLAWCAGISEELQSRYFGIGLFRSWLVGAAARILGREPSPRLGGTLTFIAMLPPGLIWAFGHVGYAVYPAYSRLIELILMALLLGWMMLRFGLIAVIFAHVVLNSVLMAVQLGFDGLPGDAAAGVAGILLPALIGWLLWRLHGRRSGGKPKLDHSGSR